MSADAADIILSPDQSVGLKLCINWLVNHIKEEFQKWRQTNIFHQRLLNCLLTFTYLQLKKRLTIDVMEILKYLNFLSIFVHYHLKRFLENAKLSTNFFSDLAVAGAGQFYSHVICLHCYFYFSPDSAVPRVGRRLSEAAGAWMWCCQLLLLYFPKL